MQFHPLAYIVKLEIEMSMADLIVKVARGQRNNNHHGGDPEYAHRPQHSTTASGHRLGISTTAVASHLSNRRSGYKTMAGETPADQIEMAASGGHQHRTQSRRRSSSVSSTKPDPSLHHRGGGDRPHQPEDGIFTTHEVHVEYEESSASSTCPLSPKAIAETIEELDAAEHAAQTPPRNYAAAASADPAVAGAVGGRAGSGDGRIQPPPKASFRNMLGRRN